MIVYIVLVNGKVFEVFDSLEAANTCCKNMLKKWNLSSVIEKEVKSL